MLDLEGKKILLGISGSIAAYKSAFLTRLLVTAGAEVQVIMTSAATTFISPLTLSTLSKKTVFTDISSAEGWNNHVELGLWADAMIIAPATATTLAKLANGICDNLLAAVYLSARCPILIAPAMDMDMWKHPATRHNIARLQGYGNHLIPVGYGELASGLTGEGRMPEPEEIIKVLQSLLSDKKDLQGLKILITAGPTYEPIDPVRFIGNRSSGRMGIELAKEAARRGAKVKLVLGPGNLEEAHPAIETIRVETAQEMYTSTSAEFIDSDITILAAAVSDYRPRQVATSKIKKSKAEMEIPLEKTVDIAAALGERKREGQLIIGFALETDNELTNAQIKLEAKNFDFIVLNSLREKGAGFNYTTNKITIVHRDNKIKEFELKSKQLVAADILDEISKLPLNVKT